MNKKLKCILAAVMALVMLVSAFIAFPATAAEKKEDAPAIGKIAANIYLAQAFAEKARLAPLSAEEDVSGTEPEAADIEDTIGEPVVETAPEETEADPLILETEPTADPSEDVTEGQTEDLTEAPTDDPESIGAVTTIDRTDPAEDAINLEWNKVSGAKGYHVFWRNADADGADYSLLSSVKSTSLTIRNLKKGAMYYFRISAYKTYNGSLIEGDSSVIRAGTTPTGVTNFRLVSGVPTGTVLRWTKNSLCDGYILYRGFEGKWSLYKKLDKNATEFTDTGITPGKAYYYRLCTYREDSRGTLASPTSLVRTVAGLCAPLDKGTTTLLRKMYFKWSKNQYAQGYEILYSSDNKNFKGLIDTKNTYYTSNRFISGKHYYFRIVPYRYVGTEKTKVYGTYLKKDLVITNSAYGKEVPSTYIEINIAKQHMWYYIKGELYVSTDVVTGNYGNMDTPKGYWAVNSKASPCELVGDGYVSYVQYWMAFIGGGWGIHDASWRDSYGGTIYMGNGSHGCVNTPYNAVKKMYAKVTIGTPVIVY